jgi:hypothetical protein
MIKDPDAVLDYTFDWTEWLAGDTITSYTITVPSGITKNSDSEVSTGKIQMFLSGGTAGVTYPVACKISTATRIDERTMQIRCEER